MPGSNYDRDLSVKEGFVLKKFLVKWEMILVYIMVLINVLLAVIKPDLYFTHGTVQSMINAGLDVSPLVLGMVFILLLGDIDVSVAAQMILGGMVTALLMIKDFRHSSVLSSESLFVCSVEHSMDSVLLSLKCRRLSLQFLHPCYSEVLWKSFWVRIL